MLPRVLLFVDFDSTLTTRDTLSVLADIPQRTIPTHAPQTRPKSPAQQEDPRWTRIVNVYMSDFHSHISAYSPPVSQRSTPAAESAYLASLAPIEAASFERAQRSGLFDGLTPQDMRAGGAAAVHDGRVVLREGWREVFRAALVGRVGMAVVSVNWSAAFVRGCLEEYVLGDVELENWVKDVRVFANEIASGGGGGGMFTSADKMCAVRENAAQVHGAKTVVYVGDSITDLDCLLAADMGICVREDSDMSGGQAELARRLDAIGVQLKPLAERVNSSIVEPVDLETSERIIYWTSRPSTVTKLLSVLLESNGE